MPATIKYVPNPNLIQQIKVDPGVGGGIEVATQEVLERAQSSVPIGETSDLHDSLKARMLPGNVGEVSVNSDGSAPYWIFPEYGVGRYWSTHGPQSYLRSSLTAVGLKVTTT